MLAALFTDVHDTVCESGHTLLLVDLDLGVEVDASNDHVANDVDRANDVKDVRVFEGDSLRHLHHSKNDDDVGSVATLSVGCERGAHVQREFGKTYT